MSEAAAILDRYRRQRRRAGIVAAISIASATVWTAWAGLAPDTQSPVAAWTSGQAKNAVGSTNTTRITEQDVRGTAARLDESVFNARLWVPPPRPIEALAAKPPEPPPPPPPPPPFKLQLVGLQRGAAPDDVFAMVYDPEAFKVTRVSRGASIGRYTLDHIDAVAGEAVFLDNQHPGKPRHILRLTKLAAPKTPLKIVNVPKTAGGTP